MLKHFSGFLVGISVGVLIVAVAFVGGGYMLLTKDGMMKTVEESVGSSVGMDLSEEQENLSLLEYGKSVLDIVGNLSTTPIKDIEGTVGINKISATISDAIGIDAGVIGESSISNLGATITNNLTMTIMQEKFDVALPDLPLFQDEEFLSKPVSEAFGDLDQNTLDSFIEVVYDEEATEENPASSVLMQKLGKKTMKEVSEDMDAIIQDIAIGEVMEIGEDSTSVLKYLKDTKIGELDGAIKEMTIGDAIEIGEDSTEVLKYLKDKKLDEIDGAIKDMTIGDAMEIGEDSSKVLKYLKDKTLDELDTAIKEMTIGDAVDTEGNKILTFLSTSTLDGLGARIDAMTIGDAIDIPADNKVLNYLKDTTLNGLSAKIDMMTIGDAVDIQDGVSHPIMVSIADLTLTQLGDKATLQGRINGLKLGDVVEVNEDSARILKALKDTTVGGLSDKMNNLTLAEVLDKHNVGVLSLIDPNTKVQEVGFAASTAVTGTSLYALCQAGVFTSTPSSSTSFEELVNRVHKNNATPDEIIKDFNNNNGTPSESITHSIFLYNGSVQNTAYLDTCKYMLLGINRPGYEGEVDLASVTGLEVNASGAFVITPGAMDAILAQAGIGSRHSVIFFVDEGIDIEIQANEVDGEYENYNRVFSIMYDANNATTQGTLYFGKGVSNLTTIGGCAVYVADEIKVQDENGNYVDYVLGEELPIELKGAAREVMEDGVVVTKSGYNTWINAYYSYGA